MASAPIQPIMLRPRSLAELLDGGFRLYRMHFIRLLNTSMLLLPLVTLLTLFQIYVTRELENMQQMAQTTPDAVADALLVIFSMLGLTLLLGLVNALLTVILGGAMVFRVYAAIQGQAMRTRHALKLTFKRIIPLTIASVAGISLWTTATMLGVCFVYVGAVAASVIMIALLLCVIPSVLLERLGGFASIGRSFKLGGRQFGRAVAVSIALVLVIFFLPSLYGPMYAQFMPNFGSQVTMAMLGQFVHIAILPYAAALICLTYYDFRIRTEAMDLHLAAREAGVL